MSPVVIAIVVAVLVLVGLFGIVVPVLPGSITIGVAALVWAIWGSSTWGWWAFGIVAVLVAVGMTASLVLTKRNLDRRAIPTWPVTIGLVGGVIGFFVIPALGLPIGFVIGLFVAELVRVKDVRLAGSTTLTAVKAIGLGMGIELVCALAAATVLGVNIVRALG